MQAEHVGSLPGLQLLIEHPGTQPTLLARVSDPPPGVIHSDKATCLKSLSENSI